MLAPGERRQVLERMGIIPYVLRSRTDGLVPAPAQSKPASGPGLDSLKAEMQPPEADPVKPSPSAALTQGMSVSPPPAVQPETEPLTDQPAIESFFLAAMQCGNLLVLAELQDGPTVCWS